MIINICQQRHADTARILSYSIAPSLDGTLKSVNCILDQIYILHFIMLSKKLQLILKHLILSVFRIVAANCVLSFTAKWEHWRGAMELW